MKAEPRRLIPRKVAATLELLIDVANQSKVTYCRSKSASFDCLRLRGFGTATETGRSKAFYRGKFSLQKALVEHKRKTTTGVLLLASLGLAVRCTGAFQDSLESITKVYTRLMQEPIPCAVTRGKTEQQRTCANTG